MARTPRGKFRELPVARFYVSCSPGDTVPEALAISISTDFRGFLRISGAALPSPPLPPPPSSLELSCVFANGSERKRIVDRIGRENDQTNTWLFDRKIRQGLAEVEPFNEFRRYTYLGIRFIRKCSTYALAG